MTNVDQFESVFRAAARTVYEYERPATDRVLVVTDLPVEEARQYTDQVRRFLDVLPAETRFEPVAGDRFRSVGDLIALVEKHAPDLILSFRHLHSEAWKWPYSLGQHLDVLTQVAAAPVMVLPHPERSTALPHALENTDRVMAITDHLTGDHRLINWAVRFAEPEGTLYLAHVEDQAEFERFLGIISRIPAIDSDVAREAILARLLKEPEDFIKSVRKVLRETLPPMAIESIVTVGHHLAEYRKLVDEHELDLLVMNTRDDEQFAMHGLAYPLAVELRSIPLLML